MIDLQPSPEQNQIIDSVAGLLAARLPIDRLRSAKEPTAAAEANRDSEEWSRIGELGVFGLGLGEDDGGFGYGLVEEVLVAREFGRVLASPAFGATMLAVHLAAAAGERDLLESLQSGSVVVAQGAAVSPGAPLAGAQFMILDGVESEWTLVANGASLALVRQKAWEAREARSAIDPTVTLEKGTLLTGFADKPGDAIVSGDPVLLQQARLLAAAYLVGIAEAAQVDSVGYAAVRQQFGQPIGAFQAIKHRCADMLARAAAAWNLTLFAALSEAAAAPDAIFQALSAKIIAGNSASVNAAVNIQNHGGIGFTREHHAHLFVKRAHMFDFIGGSGSFSKACLLACEPPLSAA